MSNAIEELSKLNFNGIKWISQLKNQLCLNGTLAQSDIDSAFQNIHSDEVIEDIEVSATSEDVSHSNKSLFQLRENENVGGLYNNKKIEFSPNLTLIYGKNGSGKSSYYKILKDAFHSKQNIVGNIYNTNNNAPSSNIEFRNKDSHLKWQKKGSTNNFSNNAEIINWTAGSKHSSLLKFCDGEILSSSLSKRETGWSIDRYKLEYYEKFRNAIEQVESKVRVKLSELNSGFEEKINIIINGLKLSKDDAIKAFLTNNKASKNLILDKCKELYIVELTSKDIEQKPIYLQKSNLSIQELLDKTSILESKIQKLDKVLSFTLENTQIYAQLELITKNIVKLSSLKESIDFTQFEKYQLLFNPKSHQDDYVSLLKKIAETALTFGFDNYPSDVEKCFYCNQTLEEENKSLLKNLHDLIDNEVSTEIQRLSKTIEEYAVRIEKSLIVQTDTIEFSEINQIWDIQTKSIIDLNNLQTVVNSKEDLIGLKQEVSDLIKEPSSVYDSWVANELLFQIAKSEKEILTSQKNDLKKQSIEIEKIRKEALNNLNKIEDIEFCITQRELVKALIETLESHQKYNQSYSTFQGIKTKVSRDKGRVEDDLIRNNYISRFNENLEYFELAKREKIIRSFSNPSGSSKIDGKIDSNGRKFEISSILSEGEAKVFSLCDWLTELDFDDNEILVFDDPITSLDQVNIYKLVDKIIDLSKSYQVIVFTHNFEFYHRLIQKSLGGSPLHKGKCEICKNESEQQQCIGFNSQSDLTHKCCSYYQIEHILQPGSINEEVMFLSLDWEKRIEVLRSNLLAGDIREADKHIRTTINNFFERFVLGDIKRKVYKNNDLIKEWRDIREISETDYNLLMDVHNKISGESGIHESSPEVRTALDVRGYIDEFNKMVRGINNMRSFNNPSMTNQIEEILI
ncbi:MAG: AAA family ATPase [Lishizhenia sp.]